MECVRRRVYFDLDKAKSKLHLLKGLGKILLDIDKAIKIVRETEEDAEVIPNLMIGFGIDKEQAEYVADIKLRHLNKEYILKRLEEIEELEKKVEEYEGILSSKSKIKKIIIDELQAVIKKHGQPRKTEIFVPDESEISIEELDAPDDYPVTLFFTKGGYFKKITPQSLRMSGEQKLKEGDEIAQTVETSNTAHLLFFTNQHQVYKSRASEFEDSKASLLGDFVAAKLEMDPEELPVYMAVYNDYNGYMIFAFENGKIAKVDMSAYETKTNRKKLIKAYCNKFPLAAALHIKEDVELLLKSSNGRMLLFHTGVIASKTTKDTQGVAVMTQKRSQRLVSMVIYEENMLQKPHRYRSRSLPVAGQLLSTEEKGEQLTFE